MPEGDTPPDDMVREPIVTLPYQSMPVFPKLTIMVVEKPKTKTHQSQTADANIDNVTQTEPPSGETPIKMATGATVTKPSQHHTPESVIGKDKLSPKAVPTLPMVTPTRKVPPPIKHASQMVHGLGIKHDYIEVLTVEGDEVLHLHTRDITANKCTVNLEKLSASDIENLNQELQEQQATDIPDEPDIPPLKRKKHVSFRPKREPSATRLAAQEIIRKSKPDPVNIGPSQGRTAEILKCEKT